MKPRSPLSTLLWALYCACSWTWCIGLYLPHLLLERYGWPGFVSFAMVNVAGAAAFGFVVGTARRSQDMVRTHGGAMRWFSIVTLAFHVFFLGYLCKYYSEGRSLSTASAVLLPLGACVVALGVSLVPIRFWPWMALLVYGLSVGTFARVGWGELDEIGWSGSSLGLDLLWTMPILVFGFLLCPYLDMTFHRALQESNNRATFLVFGMAFAVLLILSAAYWRLESEQLWRFVLAHMVVQSLFTMAAHIRELRVARSGPSSMVVTASAVLLPFLAAFIVPVVLAFDETAAAGTDIYLRFLVFYGLLFPGYVLFMMTRGYARPTARTMQLLLLLVLVLAPLCEAGLIHGQSWLLVFPVAVLLVVRGLRN